MFGALLVAIALVGPMVAFAGVSAVWPESTKTVDVNTSPPITFAAGADHTQANSLGFAGAFTATNNAASYTLTVSGLSGGTLTIDDLVTITSTANVADYKLQIDTALAGTLTNPDTLKVRLWTGATPPTADGDAQVCGVLDLEAVATTETATACAGSSTVKVQLIYALPDGSSGSSTVSIAPSTINFA